MILSSNKKRNSTPLYKKNIKSFLYYLKTKILTNFKKQILYYLETEIPAGIYKPELLETSKL